MDKLEKVVALAKRRGFAFPSSEIYGGMANTWDLGHYGTLLKNNLRDNWWNNFVTSRDDMVGIDASVFLNSKVWEASGHVKGFTDALIDCRNCKNRTRADHLIEDNLKDIKVEGLPVEKLTEIIKENKLRCPRCGAIDFTDVRQFNLLFETHVGIVAEDKSLAYLRGEIAQGIFLNFKNILNTMRIKLPFGIAQVGKAFRNEITMGQFLHRTLEFDLMEFEYFVNPQNWEEAFEMWKIKMWDWALSIGLAAENLRWREHEEFERSHYSKRTMDIEYKYAFGWKEMFGIAYRTDFDLKNHSENSGKDLSYVDPKTQAKFIPHVVEPTFGLSRLLGIILHEAYQEDLVNGKERIYLKLNPKIAPIKVAVFPLQKDDKLKELAQKIYHDLKLSFSSEFDDSGNIGKMYRRQDEIGTPFCLTVDYQSLTDESVTIRYRDDTSQERIAITSLKELINTKLNS